MIQKNTFTVVKNTKYEILTPEGFSDFSGIKVSRTKETIKLTLDDDSYLECTPKHRILMLCGIDVCVDELRVGDIVSDGRLVKSLQKTASDGLLVYDALDVKLSNRYITNSIVSHNCEFLGSSDTLIHPDTLQKLVFTKPIRKSNNINVFADPVPGNQYFMVVDTAHGGGGDSSAFIIMDVTSFPYSVAATFKDNRVTPMVYPNYIDYASKMYNNAYILVETNDLGQQVVDILNFEFENSGLLSVGSTGKRGQVLGGAGTGKTRFGVKTTSPVKRIGCFGLKGLLENNQLSVNDSEIVSELFTFVANGASFEASPGKHDDMVMCLVLFSWAVSQKYFVDLMDSDARARIVQEREQFLYDELVPFGFIDDNNYASVEDSKPVHTIYGTFDDEGRSDDVFGSGWG